MDHAKTNAGFADALNRCRTVFADKLGDYGAAWRILRPTSVTDQLLIKAKRIRTLETTGPGLVDEGILPEFIAIVNYAIVGLIQLRLGPADSADITPQQALDEYDREADAAFELMKRKNHDYNEAWRDMRVASYTDFILTKVQRTKQIEANNGITNVSEGIDANYMDMLNYAVFAIIKLTSPEQ